MAINTPADPMAFLNEEMNKEPEKTNYKPFFFALNDGEKALVSVLLNLPNYVLVDKHELWNNNTKKYDARAICAADLDLDCQHCIDAHASNNKKLQSSNRWVLPAYVHEVWKLVDPKQNAYKRVTYTDQEGNTHNVQGFRLLEMKRTSSILKSLNDEYNDAEDHDITKLSFVIRRENVDGDVLKTEYRTSSKVARPIPEDVPDEWKHKDTVFQLYTEACPPVVVGGDNDNDSVSDDPFLPDWDEPMKTPAKSNGKVKSVPDF